MGLRRLALLLAMVVWPICLLAQGNGRTGRVRGVVIDSLLGAPLAGATVRLMPGGRSTVSDSSGRFLLDSVPPGEWIVAFRHPALDSLGFTDFPSPVRVFGGASATVTLATTSFETIRDRFCAGTPDSLSQTVAYGRIHVTAGAPVRLSVSVRWALERDATGATRPGTVLTLASAEGSQWIACGIPWGVWIHAIVRDSTRAASAFMQMGPRGLIAHDLLLTDGPIDVSGVVRDNDGRPVRGARVSVVGTDLASETDAGGRFLLTSATASTASFDVRAAGYIPWLGTFDGRQPRTDVILHPLSDRIEGAPYGSDYVRLLERNQAHNPLLILGPELAADSSSLAEIVPSATCRWWLDGRPVDREFFLAQPRRTWRAVEIYLRGAVAPPEYRSAGCTVSLLWTAAADW